MLSWLRHFERVLARAASPSGPVAGGPGITYADFALFHALDATKAQFDTPMYKMAWTTAEVPTLKTFHAGFASRPNLASYFGSERCPPFSGNSLM